MVVCSGKIEQNAKSHLLAGNPASRSRAGVARSPGNLSTRGVSGVDFTIIGHTSMINSPDQLRKF